MNHLSVHNDVEIIMKLNRLGSVLIAGVAVLALASCAAGSGDDAATGGSDDVSEVNTDAPFHAQPPGGIKGAGVITTAGAPPPPYRTVEEGGEITGIDPDIQAALSEQLGV